MNYQDRPLNKIMLLCSLCLSVIWTTPAMSEDFSSGIFAFQKKLAANGNAQAQYTLGTMYEAGRGVAMNSTDALKWYKQSAAQNFKPANDRITYLEVRNTGYQADKHGAWLQSLKQRANSGDGEAMMLLGQMYKRGIAVERDLGKAQEMFTNAAKMDIAGTETELENTEALIKKEQAKAVTQKKRDDAAKKRAIKRQQAQKQTMEQQRSTQKAAQERSAQQRKVQLERKQIEAEKRKLEYEKRKLAKQQQMLRQQQAQKQKAAETAPASEEGFQKDACRGKKARFLTVCQ